MAPQQKRYLRVYDLLKEGCSTSRDIADETGMSAHLAISYLWDLQKRGLARKTGRVIKNEGRGRDYVVWEAV